MRVAVCPRSTTTPRPRDPSDTGSTCASKTRRPRRGRRSRALAEKQECKAPCRCAKRGVQRARAAPRSRRHARPRDSRDERCEYHGIGLRRARRPRRGRRKPRAEEKHETGVREPRVARPARDRRRHRAGAQNARSGRGPRGSSLPTARTPTGERFRPHLYLGRIQGIGGLQMMPALQPLSATGTMANLYVKLSHYLLAYDVLLILGLDLVPYGWTTTGTMLRQRGVILLIHGHRNRTAVMLAVCCPGLPAIAFRLRLPLAAGKWGGLPLKSPASFFQFLLEPFHLTLQTIVLLTQ